MRTFFHWGCLLSLALVAPIALPAGGASKTKVEYNNGKEDLDNNSLELTTENE